jgi:prepilin-type N-terminal cleavage/methylation domain-containing protein
MTLRFPQRQPCGPDSSSRTTRAFTLLEILIATAAFAIVLAAINSVFYSALRLRNQSAESFTDDLALQHTLHLLRRDIANQVPPGGTLSGQLQTTPTLTGGLGNNSASGNSGMNANASSVALLAAASRPGQSSPEFHTTTGALDETTPWSELQKVHYYLAPSTNAEAGRDLIRSVTRNLLPSLQDQSLQTPLLTGVETIYFQFHDGTQWKDVWDSASELSTRLPVAVRVQITKAIQKRGQLPPAPIEMVVPVLSYGGTNATTAASTTGGEL